MSPVPNAECEVRSPSSANAHHLTPEEEKRMDDLYSTREEASRKLWSLEQKAREAAQAVRAQKRVVQNLTKQWLPLAERKYGPAMKSEAA